MKKENGFTLLELMIVVAVVGILGAIAVSKFNTLIAKARQGEIKMAMAAVYIAEKSFYAENNSYTGCMTQAGYYPDGAVRYYSVGFVLTNLMTPGCGPAANQSCSLYSYNPPLLCASAPVNVGSPLSTSDTGFGATTTAGPIVGLSPAWEPPSTVSRDVFVFEGLGMVKAGMWDTWSIDHNKTIVNFHSGL